MELALKVFGRPETDDLTQDEVMTLTGVSRQTLHNWRSTGVGPYCRKTSWFETVYPVKEFNDWLAKSKPISRERKRA